jgi:hypothetical protein
VTAVSFTTTAQPNPGGVLFVEIPDAVVKKLGAGKGVPVRVTLDGAKYRSTIAVYGGRYYLPARKEEAIDGQPAARRPRDPSCSGGPPSATDRPRLSPSPAASR